MTSKFSSLLNKLDFSTKHPVLSQFIDDYHNRYRIYFGYTYSTALREWTAHFSKYITKKDGIIENAGQLIQLSIPEYIRYLCNKIKKLYKYKIYYENNIEQFRLVKFLIDFFGKPIIDILQVFDKYNLVHEIPQKFNKHTEIYLAMKKIYDTHLAMTLATYFVEVDIQIRHNLFTLEDHSFPLKENTYKQFQTILGLLEEDVDHIHFQKMVHENDFDLKDDLKQSLSEYRHEVDSPNCLTGLAICYGIFKEIHDFFKYKTKLKEYITSIPDLDASFGGYLMNTSVTDKSASTILCRIIRNTFQDYVWLEKIIDPINRPNRSNKTEKFDLKIPNFDQSIHNGPIIIDI